MTKKTLKALKGSIKKWEKIVDGTGVDEETLNCPLCQIILGINSNNCIGTPYKDWYYHYRAEHLNQRIKRIYCPECEKLAKEELKFLKGLLPK